MKDLDTPYGKLCVGEKEELFDKAVSLVEDYCRENGTIEPKWALTGGSTPADFYRYCVEKKRIPEELAKAACWFTSDERTVPIESDDSNFGTAARMLLDPLGVADEKRFPWATLSPPETAAQLYNQQWMNRFSPFTCFDVCFLGMGEDCHIASIFPQSPLLSEPGEDFFAAVEVPGQGWRLTVTPHGLGKSGRIVVMVTGKAKAIPLNMVFEELVDPSLRPAQLLQEHAERTCWLVDTEAASELDLLKE